jgi:hypothetical protein
MDVNVTQNYALHNLLHGSNRCIKPNNKMKEMINLILQNQWNNCIDNQQKKA